MNSNIVTLGAVVLGAILATLGGFVSGQATARLERAQQARAAALLCGELLSSLETILAFAQASHGRADPFGPLTIRIIRAARREIEVYERSREAIFRLSDPLLRASIHGLMLRLSVPMDSLLDEGTWRLANRESLSPGQQADIGRRLQQTFDYLISIRRLIPPLIDKLRPLAQEPFDGFTKLGWDVNAMMGESAGGMADP